MCHSGVSYLVSIHLNFELLFNYHFLTQFAFRDHFNECYLCISADARDEIIYIASKIIVFYASTEKMKVKLYYQGIILI